jgi:O-antigen/teichoic acid export membrane protein
MDSMLNIPEDRIDSAHFVFHCSLVNFCLSIYAIPYISDIIAHERINFYAAVAIFEILFKLVIVYALYTTPFDKLETYAALLVISGVIIRFIYMQYCRKRFVEAKSKMGINRDTFRQLFSYSFWVTIGASSAVFKEQGVNILINIFFGVTINAARGVAMQIYNVVNSFGANIGTAITPQITKAYAQGDLQRSFYLTFLLTKAQGVMLLFFLIPISIEVDYLLKMWLGDVPFYSNVFTIWALILCLARTLEYTHGPLFLAIGNIKNLEIVGGGIMLLTLPICYVFLYLGFPAVSTMIISVIIEFIVMAVAFIYLKKLVSFPIYQFVKEAVLPLVIMVLTTIPLPLYLHYILPESFLRLVIIVVSSVVISCFATYFCVLSKTEKKYALQFALKKISRL